MTAFGKLNPTPFHASLFCLKGKRKSSRFPFTGEP
jgi:hypothetical protein